VKQTIYNINYNTVFQKYPLKNICGLRIATSRVQLAACSAIKSSLLTMSQTCHVHASNM